MQTLANKTKGQKVNFLWLELTNACNLECIHCYANSGPNEGKNDSLSSEDYRNVIIDANNKGCKEIQFIGGEATLHKDLPQFIELAIDLGYTFIEIYTNLMYIPSQLMTIIKNNNIHIATSLYSSVPATHDLITTRSGSWLKTVSNIQKLVGNNIPCRVGIVEMDQNADHISDTIEFIKDLGITDFHVDSARGFGRGARDEEDHKMESLCGQCSGDVLCVGPNGVVSPCIMSKKWAVGDISTNSLKEIIEGKKLSDTRQQIAEAVGPQMGSCNPECSPYKCSPYTQCHPAQCAPRTQCGPTRR